MGTLKSKLFLAFGIITLITSIILPLVPLATGHAKAAEPSIKELINQHGYRFENFNFIVGPGNTLWRADKSVPVEYNQTEGTWSFIEVGHESDQCPYKIDVVSNNIGNDSYVTDYRLVLQKPNNASSSDPTQGVESCKTEPVLTEYLKSQNRPNAYYLMLSAADGSWGIDGAHSAAYNLYYWINKNRIGRFEYDPNDAQDTVVMASYTRDKNSKNFVEDTDNDCRSVITITTNSSATFTARVSGNTTQRVNYNGYWDNTGDEASSHSAYVNADSAFICKGASGSQANGMTSDAKPISLSLIANAKKDKADAGMDPSDYSGGGSSSDQNIDSCGAGFGLGWLVCQIIGLLDPIINAMENAMKNLLTISTKDYGVGSGTVPGVNPLKTAWSAIRIISTVAMVGLALFMIIAQIFNFDFVSAYTIKKVIPKLVIAIILIQLSWAIMIAAITAVNLIGDGLQALMYAPWGGASGMTLKAIITKSSLSNGGAATAVVMLVGVGVGAASTGGWLFAILAAAIGVAVALIVALVVLIFRKLLIIALMVIAPLALLAWILPNTEKYFKMWWSNFTKLLLMYPLIMGLISVGAIFATISASSNAASGGLKLIIILFAFFAPFFLLPKTFSMSGSMMGMISGAIGKAGAKAKGGVLNSKPMKNMEAAHQYNRKLKGLEKASTSKNPFSRNYGRLQAGTLGTYGKHSGLIRAQEKSSVLKEAQQQAETEYAEATKGQEFRERMQEAAILSKKKEGDMAELHGRQVKVTKAMQDHAFSQLVSGKQGDHVRDVISHHESVDPMYKSRANEFKNDNAPGLVSLTPDVMKGTEGGFKSLTVGAAAQMDGGGWRNMSARAKTLMDKKDDREADETDELQKIINIAEAVRTNSDVASDMDQEKYGHLEEITGLDVNGGRVSSGGGAIGEKDYAGRERIDKDTKEPNPDYDEKHHYIPTKKDLEG